MSAITEKKQSPKKHVGPAKANIKAVYSGRDAAKAHRGTATGKFVFSGVQGVKKIRRGGKARDLDALKALYDIDDATLCKLLDISPRTLVRRREEGVVNKAELDRVATLQLVMRNAVELFEGDREKAQRWLKCPARALEHQCPIDLLDTEAGIRMVRDLIGQLEHGVYP
ncbi:type II RES/Xre toxin-antitoxin system antitoxin [Marinobacter halotolerans]|uniref:type II RES/Xre toxin-antitoxin system antitoxin n=1 Tax=Marinobacter halotolerans TaxID=1569211 RepID=UPI00177CD473|nr:antitoxin Xre/MbcA/ParS toxin-binding domain-containing protein [Marinobacter halotolerans]